MGNFDGREPVTPTALREHKGNGVDAPVRTESTMDANADRYIAIRAGLCSQDRVFGLAMMEALEELCPGLMESDDVTCTHEQFDMAVDRAIATRRPE